ncbi:lysophospholipase L1-like esterase [Pedobacter cryoconitis]|uniref:Lysophospholipase L1-like esterase n=1 Tax=Pedobacter cryoconitis TaxID=188932 RepID=A0A7W8ZKV7_9SPHI|nr:SGNH/GDSL hydrolase family protein [Pedobacter cryoconitis]MBB5635735.1 lysophospholipase L1-like esterase [Pedobacter cryoconitis]
MNKTVIPPNDPHTDQLTYLALGDSYTIGEQVSPNESFPYQLRAKLNKQSINLAIPQIIATTGWTTGELIAGIKAETTAPKYDLVTLLIGVNNQYRGNSIAVYRTEFQELLKTAISFAGGNAAHVFVVSIPDWGATPFGAQSGRDVKTIAKEIDAFNAVNKEEALKAGINYTDITPGSRNASADASLVAGDGLHPSGKMYKEWVDSLSPSILKTFK